MLGMPIIAEAQNNVLSGDEIISYSMANNSDGGFIFSEGRVAGFLKDKVITDNPVTTFSNLIAQGMDVLKRRSSSDFFTYEPDPEVRYYTHDEMADWMEKRNYELFNLPTTWLHSMSDESNSYFYYSLLNIISSLFPSISGTKWGGFILNYLIYLALLFVFYKLTGEFECSPGERMFLTLLLGTACDVISRICLIRAYLLAMMMCTVLALMHVRLWKQVEADKRIFMKWIIPVTVLAIFSHYSNGLAIISFALPTLILLRKNQRKKDALRYCLFTGVGILIAILLDPFSIAGLLMKFVDESSSPAGNLLNDLANYYTVTLIPGTSLVLLIAVTLYNVIIRKRLISIKNFRYLQIAGYLLISIILCTILILFGTKLARYLSILTPSCILLIGLLGIWNCRCLRENTSSAIVNGMSILFFLLTAGLNGYHSIQSFRENNAEASALRNAIAQVSDQSCILLRNRRSAYGHVPEISQFRNCQVITLSSENWESLVTEENLENNMILIVCGIEKDNIPEDWLKAHHYSVLSPIYDTDGLVIVPIKR